MGTRSFKGILLSTLIIVSLMVPAITLLSVSPASANPNPENIIVQGDADAYNYNKIGVPPWKLYKAGDPPIMAAKKVGDGSVVAAGFARTTNGGVGYPTQRWEDGELDVLFDVAFRWMQPDNDAPIRVLWYGEYIDALKGTYEYAYNDAGRGSWLIDELMAKGYKVDNTIDSAFTEITSTLLTDIDILVTPQLEVGNPLEGGDPAGLPDDVVQVIKNFVEVDGKGLFIMEMADINTYNFYRVQNKILEALNFGIYFQPDTIRDPNSADERYVTATVTGSEFGADYQAATGGKTTIRVYKVCSLAPELGNYAVSVEISPYYRQGLAGGTLEYEVKVTNMGKITDNYNLEPSDTLGWGLTISPSVLELENNFEPEYATLSVTIPPGTPIGTADNVVVTATSEDNNLVSSSSLCLAVVGGPVKFPPYYEVIASVYWVVDGDTIDVWIENIVVELDPAGEVGEYYGDNWERVRFGGGIDAPEWYAEGGPEATEFVENLIPVGTTVYLDLDNLAKDPYGRTYRGNLSRLIAVIYAEIEGQWVNINAELLRWGMEAYPGNDWDEYSWIVSEFSVYDWPPYDNSYPYVLGALVPHDPIYIDGDAGFTAENRVVAGSGTAEDPYVIKNWDISAGNANGIEIRNTTAYFIVRNCYVYDGMDNGYDGIRFENVANGRIDGVKSDNNYRGINFFSSNNNIIVNSIAENNTYGIRLVGSENNHVYHNNLINNANQAYDNGTNYWDDGYPSGGNYWSDYAGADNYWGENQNIPGSDGIGDTPYNIPPGGNQDRYPLMNPLSRGMEVSILPSYQSAPPEATLAYTVTVTNTGNVIDNYALSVGDDAGWGPSVSPESLIVLPGASDNATLSVTVPESAVPSTEDNITVTATSQTDNTVSDNDLCTAHVLSPKAELSFATLYKVALDVNLYLDQGSRLIVKFYTYTGAIQAENVVWSGPTPEHVVLLANVSHPENKAVQNATLVLTDNVGNVISTIASFTVTQDDLFGRIMDIKGEWPLPGADQDALFQEIMDIKGQWPIVPS